MMSTVIVSCRSTGGGACSELLVDFHWQDQSLLQALSEVERIQIGMGLTPDDGSNEMLREARAGAMYATGSDWHEPQGE